MPSKECCQRGIVFTHKNLRKDEVMEKLLFKVYEDNKFHDNFLFHMKILLKMLQYKTLCRGNAND